MEALAEDFKDTNLNLPEIERNIDNEGIGFLVDMAKSGKIDPWNINIVDITDKYLAHLCEMKSQNLRLTGRAFLFASSIALGTISTPITCLAFRARKRDMVPIPQYRSMTVSFP